MLETFMVLSQEVILFARHTCFQFLHDNEQLKLRIQIFFGINVKLLLI